MAKSVGLELLGNLKEILDILLPHLRTMQYNPHPIQYHKDESLMNNFLFGSDVETIDKRLSRTRSNMSSSSCYISWPVISPLLHDIYFSVAGHEPPEEASKKLAKNPLRLPSLFELLFFRT